MLKAIYKKIAKLLTGRLTTRSICDLSVVTIRCLSQRRPIFNTNWLFLLKSIERYI